MQLEFDPAAHAYRLDGRDVPSVTQVLGVLNDFDRIPPDVLENARIRGSYVDEACDLLDAGQLDWSTVDPEHVGYVEGYQHWLADSGAVVVASQLRVASASLRYAGTLDLLAHIKDGLCLIDRKATHDLPPSVGPQTAAYLHALTEHSSHRVRRRYGLHLHPKYPRGYRLTALTDTADWSVFVSCLNLHNWRMKHAA